jgi:hypothetical protein
MILAGFGSNQSPVRRPVWLWHAGKFLGVVFHCFPLLLDVPTFDARCLHVPNNASAPISERWNCGREWYPVISSFLFYMPQIYGYTSPPKEGMLRGFSLEKSDGFGRV